jgi:hypothetical protein
MDLLGKQAGRYVLFKSIAYTTTELYYAINPQMFLMGITLICSAFGQAAFPPL